MLGINNFEEIRSTHTEQTSYISDFDIGKIQSQIGKIMTFFSLGMGPENNDTATYADKRTFWK